ncbi:DUF4184 family protein [Alienimonas californiensis]|uniref:DUF4184 family protein n=1 Tax=Alienimonas californiensis TaxID=2527989 RepID=A0A517P4P6_9PLAN|nr:DUF4184 family protein [Alienimonas californiensis]QDT14343.1 hypothetical protein CA12_04150 [Alienimonas californiensis]
MPFTLTHVAAVLPALPWLRRRFAGNRSVPASALVIGSMIPDAGVFLPNVIDYWATHSVRGLFTLCLPLGMAAFLGWEYFAKAPLVDLAPEWARVRLNRPRGTPQPPLTLRTLLWAAGLIVIGAASHVLWDSFTHADRWGVQMLPVLDRVWFTLPEWLPLRHHAVPGFRFGQYGSTFLLLPVVGLYALVRLRRREPVGNPRSAVPPAVRTSVLTAFVLLPTLAAGRALWTAGERAPLRGVLVGAVIAAGITLVIAVVTYAAVHAVHRALRQRS